MARLAHSAKDSGPKAQRFSPGIHYSIIPFCWLLTTSNRQHGIRPAHELRLLEFPQK
jgi:hypothetical protein